MRVGAGNRPHFQTMWFLCAVFYCKICGGQFVNVITKLADRSQVDDCPHCGMKAASPMNIDIEVFQEAIGLKVIQ
jgi:DNA replicative helicase MCM subunit Mcm2 (Cdc46/Mcm family)